MANQNKNSLIIDLDTIPNKNTVKFVAPDANGLFEIQMIKGNELSFKLFNREEALQIAQFLIKYL